MNPTKLWNLKKFIDHGVWDQETTFEPIELVGVSCHKSRTLAPIFTNKTSFSQLSWDKCNKIMKPQKIYWPISLGPRNYIWANWAQKTYPAKSAEQSWDKCNKIMKPQKIYWPWGLGLRNYIWATRVQKTYPAISPEP